MNKRERSYTARSTLKSPNKRLAINLTCFAQIADVRPLILAHALECAPQLAAVGPVSAWIWHARRLTIFDNFRQVHGHVIVNVEDFAVDHKAAEATNQSLLNRKLLR